MTYEIYSIIWKNLSSHISRDWRLPVYWEQSTGNTTTNATFFLKVKKQLVESTLEIIL